jgi:hypothetical protein
MLSCEPAQYERDELGTLLSCLAPVNWSFATKKARAKIGRAYRFNPCITDGHMMANTSDRMKSSYRFRSALWR